MGNLSKAQAELLAAEGWVKGHWRPVALASIALNVVLLLYLLLK